MFGGQFWVGPQCFPLVEDIRPDSDVETSNWTATPLWQKLDDTSDADYVSSADGDIVCPSTVTYDFEVGFGNPAGAVADSDCQGIRVNIRVRKVQSDTGADVDITVRLKESTTTRKTSTFNNLGTSFQTKTMTLSAAEVDSIGNHNNLRVEIDATMCVALDFETVRCDCSWIEIEYYAL